MVEVAWSIVMITLLIGGSVMSCLQGIKPQPESLSAHKAWFMGLVAGDGNITYLPGRVCQVRIYCGPDQDLVKLATEAFESIYGLWASHKVLPPGKGKRKQDFHFVQCSSRLLVEDLIEENIFGVHRWRVPQKVLAGSTEIRGAWISGFFDAEGCAYHNVERSVRQVTATSVCLEGIAQVSALLTGLEITNTLGLLNKGHGKWSDSHRITIHRKSDLERFRDLVGFRSPRKREKLDQMIASYERDLVHRDVVVDHTPEITRRRKAGETHAEIAEALGLERETVAHLCYREGVEPEGREGNAAGGTRSVGLGPIERLLPKILELRAQKVKDEAIANALGLESVVQVRTAVLRARRDGRIAPVKTRLEEQLPRILALRAEGKTFREIAPILGYPATQGGACTVLGMVSKAKRMGALVEGKIVSGAFDRHRVGRAAFLSDESSVSSSSAATKPRPLERNE